MEDSLKVLREKRFSSSADMMRTVSEHINGFGNIIEVSCDRDALTFSYELKQKAIQCKTNRFGYTVLITNTNIAANELLRIYREKDAVEKSFSHMKPRLEPSFSRSEGGTRARLFLNVLSDTLLWQ